MRFVESFPVKDLQAWDRNPRVHSPEEVRAISRSIEMHGWGNPVLAQDGSNRVIAGHGRIKAAKKNGLRQVPVVFLEISDDQANSLSVADNKIADLGAYDDEKMKDLLVEFRDREVDLEALGFTADDEWLAAIEGGSGGSSGPVEGLTDPDEVPDAPEEVITQPGDLWILGSHRLLCGDCTNAEDVARVLDGAEPTLIVTDPPTACSSTCRGGTRPGGTSSLPPSPTRRST